MRFKTFPICFSAFRMATIVLGMALGLRAQALTTFSISPSVGPAGQAFEVKLLSYGFTCATEYSDLAVHVIGSRLVLSLFATEPAKAVCPAVSMLYGPSFPIPALPADAYVVYVDLNARDAEVPAGTLRIAEGVTHPGWYLKEKTALAGEAFKMQLLRDDIGNCGSSFSFEKVSVSAGNILASFLMTTDTTHVCIQDLRPFGPTFTLPALETGIYPVIPNELAVCETLPQPCLLDRPIPNLPADTLVVTKTLVMPLSRLRSLAPAVEVRGGMAIFTLPSGASGSWQAELTALDGRVLNESRIKGRTGDRVEVVVDRAPKHALSLLVLTAPDGGRSLIPIAR